MYAAFAGALLSVSCMKVETDSAGVPPEAISFDVLGDALKTPSVGGTRAEFSTEETFVSTAFFLPEGQSWDGIGPDNVPYRKGAVAQIDAAEISYDANDGCWREAGKIHFWPANGTLSFYAYYPSGLPKMSGTNPSGVKITSEDGVMYNGWTAEGDALKADFMVAVPAKDRFANSTAYYRSGVPTLFRHKLSQIRFVAYVENDTDVIFIGRIVLRNIYSRADYLQGVSDDGAWSNRDVLSGDSEYVLVPDDAEMPLGKSETPLKSRLDDGSSLDCLLMIPQDLSARESDDADGVRRAAPEVYVEYYSGDRSADNLKTAVLKFTDVRSFAWPMGTSVKYSLSFGNTDKPIEFNPSAGPWNEWLWEDGGGNIPIG